MKDEGYQSEVLNRVVLRHLLALVVGLPMLMPPGICVCQFVPCGDASTEYQETSSETVAVATERCKCSTHRDKTELASTDELLAKLSPGHAPHEHAPGCPAKLGTTPNKIAPPPLVAPDALDLAVSYCWVEVQSIASRKLTDEVLVQGSPPPLFLAHCAFLL